MNVNKPFRSYLFSWSLAWYLILFGIALVFIPHRFEEMLFRSEYVMRWFGLSMLIFGFINYVMLLMPKTQHVRMVRKTIHIVTGALLACLSWYLLLNPEGTLNTAGLPLLCLAIISTTIPFLNLRKKESDYIDISIVNLAGIGFLMGLANILLPIRLLNVDLLNFNPAYIKVFGIISLMSAGLLIFSQVRKLSSQTKLLFYLVGILSLSLISLPSLLYPQLSSMEFLLIFLLTSSLTLFWEPESVKNSFDSLQMNLLLVLFAVAFTLIFFYIVISGNYELDPFTLALYCFGIILTGSVMSAVIAKLLRKIQLRIRQLSSSKIAFKPLPVTGPVEFKKLAVNFNRMARKVTKKQAKLDREVADRTSELKESKNNLTQLLSRFKAILESTEEPLVAVNPEGKIIIFNNAISRLTGYSIRQALGKQATRFLHLKDNDMKQIPDSRSPIVLAVKEKRIIVNRFDEHYYLTDAKGVNIPVTITASPVTGPQHKVIGSVCVFRDISLEKRLRDLQNEFVFVAAHELRNPVTAITGFVEYAREAKGNKKKIKDALSAIEEANIRLSKLINSLLQVARFESGQMQPKMKTVDIFSFIEKVLSEHKSNIQNKQLKISKPKPINDKFKLIQVDPNFLHEVLSNLIRNAIKYCERKGVISIILHPSLKIMPSKFRDKVNNARYLIIEVADSGVGIPKSEQIRVFEKFYRGSNIADKIPGNGLGLFIVKKLVEKCKGKIWFESDEGKGTSFYVSFPIYSEK